MDRAIEQEHLRKADTDIAEARQRIERQHALVAHMAGNGHDTAMAKELLQTMRETLVAMEEHRDQIIKELSR
jgi:hypothetical protein